MFGRKKNKAPKRMTVVHKTGWTGDADTEGLFEENFLVAIIIGVALLVFAVIFHFVGFDINLAWFEGQNFWSTAGIIILVIFIPAIAFSTFTGRSDLVASEAIFVLLGFVMIFVAHNFDFSEFVNTFSSNWFNLGDFKFTTSTLMTVVLLITIAVGAIAGIVGGRPFGAGIIIIICGICIFAINSNDPYSLLRELGRAIRGTVEGATGLDVLGGVGSGIASGVTGGFIGACIGGVLGCFGGPFAALTVPTGIKIGALLGAGTGFGGSTQGWW